MDTAISALIVLATGHNQTINNTNNITFFILPPLMACSNKNYITARCMVIV